jgi:membrane associated rhomboid family serine protease
VVVSAIVVAVMFGTWLTRVTALAVFAVLVFVSHIFAGLTSLHVAAVGHLTAIVTAAALCLVLAVRPRARRLTTMTTCRPVRPGGTDLIAR